MRFLVMIIVSLMFTFLSRERHFSPIESNWAVFTENKTDTQKAWDITQGNKSVIVAVIDTGIDENHDALKSKLWNNPGETGVADFAVCHQIKRPDVCNKETNQIDDEGNGFIDDVHGWSFVKRFKIRDYKNGEYHMPPMLSDHHETGHGTHVAGIVAAEFNKENRTSGVAPGVSLMIVKYYDPFVPSVNNDNLNHAINAIDYAINNGARIINYSINGTDMSTEEMVAIQRSGLKNVLFVCSAGNYNVNMTNVPTYPGNYQLPNMITVANIGKDDYLTDSSNYSGEVVDIAAPGDEIYSTVPSNTYAIQSGTSMAAPFVTGTAALILSVNPKLTAQELKSVIMDSGDRLPQLNRKVISGAKLNVYKAVLAAKTNPWSCKNPAPEQINVRLPSIHPKKNL